MPLLHCCIPSYPTPHSLLQTGYPDKEQVVRFGSAQHPVNHHTARGVSQSVRLQSDVVTVHGGRLPGRRRRQRRLTDQKRGRAGFCPEPHVLQHSEQQVRTEVILSFLMMLH